MCIFQVWYISYFTSVVSKPNILRVKLKTLFASAVITCRHAWNYINLAHQNEDKKVNKNMLKVTHSFTRIHQGSRLDNQSQKSQIILSVWINSSRVVKNSDSHIHSHLSGCRWGPHPLISSCLYTFSCGAASYSERQPWQTWGSTSSNAETFKLDKLFQQSYIKQAYSRN